MATNGYLGIDAGTQGMSIIFADEDLNVLATGEGSYDMIPGLDPGCYEQNPADWENAIVDAMADLRKKLQHAHPEFNVLAIGISGQMHGEVLADENNNSLGPVRLWCDGRNQQEGDELTKRFGVKMPKRITSARWLWTIRNQTEKARLVKHITTPSGWISHRLTGEWTLGIGDAAGMFPIDQTTLGYDSGLLESFDELVQEHVLPPLSELLPAVRKAGEDGGTLSPSGAKILDLPAGIPVAAAEGDQPAALAGSLIGAAGMVSVSFGTSVCANSIGDRSFDGVSETIDHFCAPDGKPINMVWLRNGTTFMNTVVEMFGLAMDGDRKTSFHSLMPKLLDADPDCGRLLALPFMDDEPGLGIQNGGTATLIGLNPENATPGNVIKAALLSTMFNLRLGSETLDAQGFPRTEMVLTGGLTKTPELGQILADVFDVEVTIPTSAEEGTAFGAALMARFRHLKLANVESDWGDFLNKMVTDKIRFSPDNQNVQVYAESYQRYKNLMNAQAAIDTAVK